MHIAEQYARDVLDGTIVACRWVKLACQRFINDFDNPDIYFSEDAADHALDFFSFLRHSKGEWAGEVFQLELWQAFIVSNLFGWLKKSDDLRRFRTAYICVSRKNGKSTLLAGIGLYLFCADGEPGAEVFTAATKRDQAIIIHSESTRMVKRSPLLRKKIGIFKNNLHILGNDSKFEPLGADSKTYDGLNVHGAILDELHAHSDRGMWDVLETATGSRRQPLQVAITTAGFDQHGVCMEQQEYVEGILKNTITDDTYFGIVYTIDLKKHWPEIEDDDWKDAKNWIKANPNLGVSAKFEDIDRKAKKAEKIPAAINNFLTKHLDIWTQQVSRWIDIDLWDANFKLVPDEADLAGRPAFGGIDLSSVSDLTCWVLLFPDYPDPGDISIRMKTWCPEAKIHDDTNKYRDQYQAWKRLGFLETTVGDAIDYEYIRESVVKDAGRYDIKSIAVDVLFQGYEFSMRLNEELGGTEKRPKVIASQMGYKTLAGPTLEFERLLLEKKMNHGKNPVLRFMADTVAVKIGPTGIMWVHKGVSQGKIDGIIGTLLALSRLMQEYHLSNPYETRGPIFA